MRIRIDELPHEGVTLNLDEEGAWARGILAEALEGEVLALGGRLRVRAVGPGAVVEGRAHVALRRTCDRCLAEVRLELGDELDLYFQPPEAPSGEREIGLLADDLDVGFVEDGELDLGAVLAEFFLLEAPAVLRCGDPGVVRVEPGRCETPAADSGAGPDVDPRLAALLAFKDE
ncbi:MAG: DUF177 domain-containing protein [Pseudomonadota bacterium]